MASRRGSGSVTLPSGQTLAFHTRSSEDDDLPHATKKKMADHLRKYESLFTLTPQRMRMIVEAFKESLELGLSKHGQVVPMIPTYVFGWPSGNETGNFLAVDLGGTNLRVCLVTLEGEGKFEITQSKYRLSEEQKQDDGQRLFDFCAECLKAFIVSNIESGAIGKDEVLPLGFTFSYPCSQDRIDHGVLIRWTKGFGAANTEGYDVVEMFRKSFVKHSVPAEIVALTCDTTGTLIASHYVNPSTRIACIFGTGCNAAYMERVGDIPKIASLGIDPNAEMAINCEWGAFDSFEHENLPRTKYDAIIDDTSNKPGVLFLGQNTYKLEIPYSFDTAFLSLMESDPTDELLMIIGIFTHFFAVETTLAERQFFRALAKLVGRRAARLSACGIAAIVSKMGYLEEGCAVGADGSLYNKYPSFAERIHEGLVDIFGAKGRNVVTYHAEDGSGIGSAIVAAMTKMRKDAGIYPNLQDYHLVFQLIKQTRMQYNLLLSMTVEKAFEQALTTGSAALLCGSTARASPDLQSRRQLLGMGEKWHELPLDAPMSEIVIYLQSLRKIMLRITDSADDPAHMSVCYHPEFLESAGSQCDETTYNATQAEISNSASSVIMVSIYGGVVVAKLWRGSAYFHPLPEDDAHSPIVQLISGLSLVALNEISQDHEVAQPCLWPSMELKLLLLAQLHMEAFLDGVEPVVLFVAELAECLLNRYCTPGCLEDLDIAVQYISLGFTSGDENDDIHACCVLGDVYRSPRYMLLGDFEDLDLKFALVSDLEAVTNAISSCRKAVKLRPAHRPLHSVYRSQLATPLLTRFEAHELSADVSPFGTLLALHGQQNGDLAEIDDGVRCVVVARKNLSVSPHQSRVEVSCSAPALPSATYKRSRGPPNLNVPPVSGVREGKG
ncbi:Hexokinase [Grifola frondosa]|uniref:hexokinase n=1 Tax=Grifola frondosa TaxID=5627 RepID=A0A1C7MIS0_GRIFR|nr:Hexokinase [Grifola frondosa]